MKISPFLRLAVAIGFIFYGQFASSCLPYFGVRGDAAFYIGISFEIIGVLFAVVTMLVHNNVVFRIGWMWWTVRQLCRHIVIIGDTGSGKTRGAMNFIFRSYLLNVKKGAAFIVGVKGDEHVFAGEVAKHAGREKDFHVLEFRPDNAPKDWKPKVYYNFVSDRSLPFTAHAKAIVDTASANTEGNQSAYFKPAAEEAIAYGLYLLDALRQPVNLANLRDLLTNETNLKEALKNFHEIASARDDKYDILVTDFFNQEFVDAKGKDQSAGTIGTVRVYLAPFQTPEIAEVCCSEEPNTFNLSDFDSGLILVTSIPQRLVKERQFVHTYLKTLGYYQLLRRLDKPWWDKFTMPPFGFFLDELQDVVTASEDGMADHRIVDRIRSAKGFVVGGMQSETSPDPKIQETKRKVLMKNLRTRFYFRQPDEEDAKFAADYIGKKTIWKRYRSARGVLDFGGNGNQEEIHKVKTEKLLTLPDYACYVVHPSPQVFLGKRYTRVKLAPIEANGKVASWYGSGSWFGKAKSLLTTNES